MIDSQLIWLILHVFILVYWLGADITDFYGSTQLINKKNSVETRLAIIKIISFVNWFPNIANILIFPVGVMLLVGLGYFAEFGNFIFLPQLALWQEAFPDAVKSSPDFVSGFIVGIIQLVGFVYLMNRLNIDNVKDGAMLKKAISAIKTLMPKLTAKASESTGVASDEYYKQTFESIFNKYEFNKLFG